MKVLSQEHVQRHQKPSEITTASFEKMKKLKLLHLNQLKLSGSYGNFPKDLRWLCWREFYLEAIPYELSMRNLVVLDMSCSKLEIFQPPDVLGSLQILNLKDSDKLSEIRNIFLLPNLEALILWNCRRLFRVCDTLGDLTSLTLLNITGCENLCKKVQIKLYARLSSTLFGGNSTKQPSFRIPRSLERLFLKDCNIKDTDYFPLSFEDQLFLKYLNLVNGPFEVLPSYNHLKYLRVLDLSRCKKLKTVLCLPSTLSELYIYHCKSLERVTFESHRFTLQEFGYEGCVNLSEVEGFFKLVPLAMLNEADLGHMNWVINYQDLEMCLVGDEQLTNGRSWCLQMLYEFNIMSTSLPDIKNPNMMPKYEYMSQFSFLSFDVPPCPENKRLKGLNLTFKYTIQGEDWVWFAKISTNNGIKLIYNPMVFGKPVSDEVGIWLSYWPIGNTLHIGDKVDVSIVVMNGLEIHECSAGLVYADEQIPNVPLKEKDEFVGGDLSGFRLSTGAYYLCRRDFSELMEVGKLTLNWFEALVGDEIDYTEVGGWRKTGTPQQPYHSYTELRTVRCVICGPQSDEIYKIAEMSKLSFVNKIVEFTNFTSRILGNTMKSGTTSETDSASPKDSVTAHYGGLDSHQTIKHINKKMRRKMEKDRMKLTNTGPDPHEYSEDAIFTIVFGFLYLIIWFSDSSDNTHTLIQKLDNNTKLWSLYAFFIGFFYFFSSPFVGKTIKPSYSNFSRWYTGWMLVAAVYHLPSFQLMGVDMRMNLSLFFTIYISSIFVLLLFHLIFLGLSYVGLVSRVARRRPDIFTILQNCAVLSLACCVFHSHCGNNALNEKRLGRSDSRLFSLWIKGESSIWLLNFKDEFCKSWFVSVGSAGDYPLLSKWVIYGQFSCTGPCESSDEISPVYSLWATFIGLYMANYVVERSAGWALTHPISVEKTEKLKNKRKKPNFLDMVPWFSGTSADLFKTIFDLLVSATVYVGRFDMRMLQAAMSWVHEGAKEEYLYDHLNERNELWFDFMADTGDDGNSTYSVARLLAQPVIHASRNDSISIQSLLRGDLLLIGGNLAHPNPSAFSYEKRFFGPFEYALQPPSDAHIAVDKPELPVGVSELKYYDGPQCFVIPGNHDWSDGLETFTRYICQKSWLGGWLMPQKKSYFALQLPKGWWVFGLDLALHRDIDVYQLKFFAELIEEKVKETDSVIIMTHEPNWILDWYWNNVTGKNVTDLVKHHLKGRCKLRMAGDLHHYMRHSRVPSKIPNLYNIYL